jgi:hypothetical protein
LGDDVTAERGVQRSATVDDQNPAVAGRGKNRLEQRVVLKAPDSRYRPAEDGPTTELPELGVTTVQVSRRVRRTGRRC